MGINLVHVVNTDPPKWQQDQRRAKGLDPMTGRQRNGEQTPAMATLTLIATLAGIGLFLWFCVSLVITFVS